MRIKKAFVNDQTWGCRPDFSCSPGGELDRRALAKVSLRGGLIEFQQGTALEEIIRLLPPLRHARQRKYKVIWSDSHATSPRVEELSPPYFKETQRDKLAKFGGLVN